MPHIMKQRVGSVMELARNPLGAMLAASMFKGSRFRRGMPTPARYSLLKSDAFDGLDEANREHVAAVLRDRSQKLGVPVADLGWAISARKVNGLHAVSVKKWEDIERQQWEAQHP